MDINGKAAIVTGGGTGVGRATALALARQGCSVAINYSRSKDDADATLKELLASGIKAIAVRADVADDEACRALVTEADAAFGRLDILVNNAATTSFIPHANLEGVKAEDWQRIFAVNVMGAFQCARAAAPVIQRSGGGEIVNVSSTAGIAAIGSSIPYCASKAAMNNMTVSLARVLAPDIRVNAVAPGFITTRWFRQKAGEAMYERVKTMSEEGSPLKQVCTPEDVASLIVSLITGPDLITGQVIPIEGGTLIHR